MKAEDYVVGTDLPTLSDLIRVRQGTVIGDDFGAVYRKWYYGSWQAFGIAGNVQPEQIHLPARVLL